MAKKVIIFDLDGTLINTLEDLADSTNYALRSVNYPQRTIDEIREFVGNGVFKLIEHAVHTGTSVEDINKVLEIFKKHYSENMYNKTAPYDGIIDALKQLKQKGYNIAVVSNKYDTAVKDLCEKYFPDLIDIAIGENESAGIKKKPSADMVNIVLKELKSTPDNTIYVGDSDVDLQTAKNAHIDCISVTWGFKSRKFLVSNGAKTIINKVEELIDTIEKY